MRQKLLLLWICGLACSIALPNHAAQPWLSAVGGRTVVCCSPTVAPAVRQAAERVLAELQRVRADAGLVDPDTLNTDYATLGTNHVICVGQWADNAVLRMTWGHWANSRQQRQWQAEGEQRAMELTGLWEKDIPEQAWRWQHDFFAFGYGDFDGADVGYVQTVRNPFPVLLRSVPRQEVYDTSVPRPFDLLPANQMYFVIHLTGTGPAGVIKAVEVFLRDGLLNGVAPGAVKPSLDDWTLQGLGPRQLATDLPAWAPVAELPTGIQYVGQQMPGSHLYGGFCEVSGVRPQRIWRLKYRGPGGFRFFESFPTNRASGNELLIAACASAEEANSAATALQKSLPPDPEPVIWQYGGHSYVLFGTSVQQWLTWEQARAFCEKLGGHLITLDSQEEQDALTKALGRAKIPTIFIGLSGDWRRDQWAWVTGEPTSFQGWRTKNGKKLYGFENQKGAITPAEKIPSGPHQPVRITIKPDAGWYLDDKDLEGFVCEWDKPDAAPEHSAPTRIATRGQYVLMQSFDDPAGEAVLRKGAGQ